LIRDASNIHDWVLDCFVGGGTIFIAAEKTRRRAAGVEIDPLYCDVAIERWQAFTGESAVLVDTGQTFSEVARDRLAAPPSAVDGSAGGPK
jgi:DNA modification methylase